MNQNEIYFNSIQLGLEFMIYHVKHLTRILNMPDEF